MNIQVSAELARHRSEILRALRNGRFERTPEGLYFPGSKTMASGGFRSWVNDEDEISSNLVVNTGLDLVLQSGLVAGTYYIAPYSNNVAPTGGLTASTAPGTLGEFTNYTEATRQQWVKDSEASQTLTNGTTKAVFTMNTGGGTIWGAFMTSANTKSATTGTLVAAAQFSGVRTLLATDTLTLQYTITLTSS